jgi:hypothetical protein
MATSLNIDPELLEEAIALDQESSVEAIVEKALRTYIQYLDTPRPKGAGILGSAI